MSVLSRLRSKITGNPQKPAGNAPVWDTKGPVSFRDYTTVEGRIDAILDECRRQGLVMLAQEAYVLATAEHETNGTFLPVEEGYYLKNPKAFQRKLRYFPYYGRGLVQLTWKFNYERYARLLGIDLVGQPELALRPEVSTFILVHGCLNGVFTGKAVPDYINTRKIDFVGARRVINGSDRARHIAGLADRWFRKLKSEAS